MSSLPIADLKGNIFGHTIDPPSLVITIKIVFILEKVSPPPPPFRRKKSKVFKDKVSPLQTNVTAALQFTNTAFACNTSPFVSINC